MRIKPWFFFALCTTVFWGIWGALSELPVKEGFPPTLGYVVWAFTMIIPTIIALKIIHWKPERHKKALLHGLLIGFFGAAGQLILFEALKRGPAYLVFPFVSLSPLVTIFLSLFIIKEKASVRSWAGIVIALIAIPLLSYQPPGNENEYGSIWILLSLLVFLFWGIQAYFIRVANYHMKAESIFFYMTIASIGLIPFALLFTDFNEGMNWSVKWPFITAGIQILNAVGALFIVYAFRYGKAIIVSPLTNTGAPVITIILSLLIYGVFPHFIISIGMLMAIIAIFLMAE